MPTFEFKLSSGSTYEVDGPEGATEEQLMNAVASQLDPTDAATERSKNTTFGNFLRAQEKPGLLERTKKFVSGVTDEALQGMTFNLSDEIGAAARFGARAITDPLTGQETFGSFQDALDKVRGEQQEFRQENPIASTVGQVAGGLATGVGLSKSGLSLLNAAKPTVTSQALRGAGEGALLGAAFGAGGGEGAEDRLRGALTGAATGGVTGGVGGAISGAFSRSTAPTSSELGKQATATYQAVDDAGVKIAPASLQKFVQSLPSKLDDVGFDEVLHPRAARALTVAAERSGGEATLSQVDRLRRVIKNASASPDASERKVAAVMLDELDDYVSGLSAVDVTAGDPASGRLLKQARDLWTRKSKSEAVETLVERARTRSQQFSGSGYENALRTEFRGLAQNPKRMRLFKPAEQEAIKKVAKGGPIGNALRFVGKFAARGVVSGGVGAGAGLATGNPAVTAGIFGAGEAGRFGATAATARNARLAEELMRSGGQAFPRAIPGGQDALMRALLLGSGQQGSRIR